ncbi:MAG: high-affinity branched-chain amino acid ABC transporter permease LivM, partial [Alphaproteobacteria bacterium]|nr:high-affinity branched-chain amino acid ABC transporter permease LivM [Alphaproteobacteria bacterium]
MTRARLKNAFITSMIVLFLALPLAGVKTEDGINGTIIHWRIGAVAAAALLVFVGRLLWEMAEEDWRAGAVGFIGGFAAIFMPFPTAFLHTVAVGVGFAVAARAVWAAVARGGFECEAGSPSATPLPNPPNRGEGTLPCLLRRGFPISEKILAPARRPNAILGLMVLFACVFPATPMASRYALDVATMVLTYVMLAWGLNITVGYAGLLDIGYAGFYAIGAYCYALLSQHIGIGFWSCLPLAGLAAAFTGFLLGFPVLRLRGDYFAIVTLGFGEIVRLVATNWTDLTNGPNGIAGIPRPTFFGLKFARFAPDGQTTFADFFHIAFNPNQRIIFLYYIILVLAVLVGLLATRLRRLPLGRAWESFRENEIACASLGINSTWIKIAAYSLGALVAGLAGAFFAARQGFVSPESFTFTESATVLAIVILGGIGHPLGIVLASIFIIGMPELFR